MEIPFKPTPELMEAAYIRLLAITAAEDAALAAEPDKMAKIDETRRKLYETTDEEFARLTGRALVELV